MDFPISGWGVFWVPKTAGFGKTVLSSFFKKLCPKVLEMGRKLCGLEVFFPSRTSPCQGFLPGTWGVLPPQKLASAPQKGMLEDYIPFKITPFQGDILIFGGVKPWVSQVNIYIYYTGLQQKRRTINISLCQLWWISSTVRGCGWRALNLEKRKTHNPRDFTSLAWDTPYSPKPLHGKTHVFPQVWHFWWRFICPSLIKKR